MNKILKVGGLSALIVASAIGGAVVMGTGTSAQAQPAQQAAYALQSASFDVLPERGPGPLGNVLTTVAKALGMDEAALRTELQAGKTIADLAKAKGVSAEALADAILAAHKPELVKAINDGTFMKPHAGGPGDKRGGPGQMRGGPGGPMMGVGAGPDALAKALGLEPAALRTELQAGKSIADIAKAKSIDLATVKATLVKAEKDALAAAVTAGKLTQAQADKMSANIETRIDAMLNGSGRPGFPGLPGNPGRGPQDPRPQQKPAGPKI